jgi:Pyruvate/2-oxoacid:ferredoxin oxidoreductase delta subunit
MNPKVCRPFESDTQGLVLRPAQERIMDFDPILESMDRQKISLVAKRCLADHLCTYCEVCQLLCPDQCITRDPDSGDILIDLKHCKGCGLCAHFCPKGAIQLVIEKGDEQE